MCYLVCGSLSVSFGSIQLGFGLLVKVEAVVILGEVKVYISVLLYSNKLELFSVLRHVGHSVLFSLFFFFIFFLMVLFTDTVHWSCCIFIIKKKETISVFPPFYFQP